jgi:hypothetical protein
MEATGKMSSEMRVGLKMCRQRWQGGLSMRASCAAELWEAHSHDRQAASEWLSKVINDSVDLGFSRNAVVVNWVIKELLSSSLVSIVLSFRLVVQQSNRHSERGFRMLGDKTSVE